MAKGSNLGTLTAISATQARSVLKGVYATNANAAARWLQVFDKATAPATNDVPVYSFLIPIGGAVDISRFFSDKGVNCLLGIAFGISTAPGTYQAATAAEHVINWNVG
jgi:hypothetical protein